VSVLDRAFGRATAWAGANFVPLVLLPLAALLVWVAVWRVWLPPVGGSAETTRTVTTVDANAPTRPTHRITTVVKTTRLASPSRRSELLALALVFLGAGAAVIGVFHNRIGSLELGKDGVKIDLTAAERSGAAALVGRLAGSGAGPASYAKGLERYVRSLAAQRGHRAAKGAELAPDDPMSLANGIADDLV
jgi:hypothetical protein